MAIRELRTLTGGEHRGSNEFNLLKISNPEEFFSRYRPLYDYCLSPFQILAKLEAEIKFKNDPPRTISITFRQPSGEVIFHFVAMKDTGSARVVEYKFDSTGTE